MNEDAFARRFYADRSELEALGIVLVGREAGRRPGRAGELLAPAGELPPAADRVHRRGAGRAAHGAAAARRRVRLRRAAAARAPADLVGPAQPADPARAAHGRARASPARPAATRSRSAWPRSRPRSSGARRSCSTTTRWSATRSATRRVDPYQLLYQGGQFYVVGRSHERDAIRVFRLSRIRGKVGYATKAEHDFQRPARLRPARVRQPDRLAVRRPDRRAPRSGSASRIALADRAPLRPLRRDAPRRRGRRPRLHHALRQRPPADRLGARPRRERADRSARPSSSAELARAASSC